jgi:hypothetical protein
MEGLGELCKAHGFLLGAVLYVCKRLLLAALRLLGWLRRSVLELAAWLGFQGKRVLIFFFLVYLVAATHWMFGGWVATKLAAVFFVFAWTAPKRRAIRNARAIGRLDQRVTEMGEKVTKTIRDTLRRDGGGLFEALRRGQPKPGSLPQATVELAEVEGSTVEFEPVLPLLRRRRRR